MATATALKRTSKKEIVESAKGMDAATAAKVASAWQDVAMCEDALAMLDTGVVAWRAAPPAQGAMAAMVADMIDKNDAVMCVGFQPYAWQRAFGTTVSDVLCTYLGKQLPQGVMAATAEDAATAISARSGQVTIVALHAENAADWKDVRAVSAAAVKAEAPVLVLISADIDAPKGVTVESYDDVMAASVAVRDAMVSVRAQGAIRVISMKDVDPASVQNAMMEISGMTADAWDATIRKNADGAELAVTTAYQAPVKSF